MVVQAEQQKAREGGREGCLAALAQAELPSPGAKPMERGSRAPPAPP